jgi:hypothetical protein
MANIKISQLTAKGEPLAPDDLVEISKSLGGGLYETRSVTGANILSSKQDTLSSGINIKTVEGQNILGPGNIEITKTDIGLANVDNTSDANKPISTATQAALNAKQNTITNSDSITQGTTNLFLTTAERTKLTNTSGTNTGDNATNSQYSGLVSNATHTGDAEGSVALTVKGINGTLLSNLGTGILKNTTTTGVPSIAVAADFPTLNQNTTGTAANVTGIVALANGGTGTATPSLVAGTNVTITGTFPNQTINSSGGGSTSPAGSNTQIQYNNSGVFGASSKFSWSNANEGLSIISESGAGTRGLALHQHQTGPQAAAANFLKSRGTNASPIAVTTGDIIGIFNFRPYIGTTYGQDQCLFGASMTSTTGVSQFFIAGTTGSNYTPNLLVAENGNVTVGNLGTGTIITSLTLPTSKIQVAGNAAIGFTTATAAPTNGLSVSGTVNIGTNTSVTTAALQVSSTTQGFLPPVMTTTQKNAIASPASGLIVYDTNLNALNFYNGTSWLSGGGTEIGALIGGGIVVAVFNDNGVNKALVASLTNLSTALPWTITAFQPGPAVPLGATSYSDGFTNTNNIISQTLLPASTSYAAGIARLFAGGGFSDWYLPANWELNMCYDAAGIVNRILGSTNGFQATTYQSSTERNPSGSWYLDFFAGSRSSQAKSSNSYVRAVRIHTI